MPQPPTAASTGIVSWAELVIAQTDVSKSRARQLRWVAREMVLATNHPDFSSRSTTSADTPAPTSAHTLLQPTPISAYLDLASRGELRTRAKAGDPQATNASMRIRADCLKILGEHAGIPVNIPDRPKLPELRETVDGPLRSQLREYLAKRADFPGAPAGRVRLFAIIGVVLDTGARVGELAALTMTDLAEDLSTVRMVRKPQARSTSAAVEERIRLSEGTRAALRGWLAVRDELVRPLNGTPKALWVSVSPNHAGRLSTDGDALRRPPGMPLMPRGMQRAYSRAVVEANVQLAGTPGWEPLPHRFEQLRRAVSVKESAREVLGEVAE